VNAPGILALMRLMRHSLQPRERELIPDERGGEPNAPRGLLPPVSPGARQYEGDEPDRPLFRKFFPIQEPDGWVPNPQPIEFPKYSLR
jgi:hypothetical protein